MKPFLLSYDMSQIFQHELTAYLDTRSEVRNWLAPFFGTLLIVADVGQTASSLAWLIRRKYPTQQFAVTPLDMGSVNGWMNPKFWELIQHPTPSARWPSSTVPLSLAALGKLLKDGSKE
jgi:hypothetical protein